MKTFINVKDYSIEIKEYASGAHSMIYKAKKQNPKPSEPIYIAKRFPKSQANFIFDQLAHELKYHQEYLKANVTTKFI